MLFVQFTPNSELASRIRDVFIKLKPWTGLNLKVIERVGEKIEDMIHRSNPWDDVNCERAECFSCKSSAKMSEPKYSYCKTRSIVYQTWCQTCLDSRKLKDVNECESKVEMGINIVHTNVESVNEGDKCNSDVNSIHTDRIMMKNDELTLLSHSNDPNVNSSELEVESTIVNETCSTESPENIEYSLIVGGSVGSDVDKVVQIENSANSVHQTNVDQNLKKRALENTQKGPLYSYIGETSRSAFERGLEHLKDLEYRRTKSHYLRHAVECHPGVSPESLDFRMKILSSHRSAFERQIREAVMIEMNNGPHLMNRKLEYSRCALPKMTIRFGNKDPKEDPKVAQEKSVIEQIKLMYKKENKREAKTDLQSPRKKSKIEVEILDAPKEPQNSTEVQDQNSRSLVSDLKCVFEKQINVRSKPSPMKVKKVPRSKVKLKLSPKVKSPVKKLGAQKRSMSPELSTEIGSPEQDQSTIIGSPAPELGIETGSPDPKLCNNIGSPSPIQGAERGSVIPDSETDRVSSTSNRVSNSLASGLHPDMVDSPSLRPVKIKNIIDNFENNFEKGQCKVKMIDAFEALMMSGGKGDTLRKTPKKKPKRLNKVEVASKAGSVMDRWLSKLD